VKSLAAQITQSRLTFIIGGHRHAARRYNICVADGSIGGGIGGRIFLLAGRLSPGSRLVYGHVDAVHNQLDNYENIKTLVSMRIRIQLFSSMLIPAQGGKPLQIHALHNQLDRAGETIKMFLTVCRSALVSMRMRIKLFSSMRIRVHGAKPLRIHAVHIQLDRAGETTIKMFITVVWIRLGFNADTDPAF
jgi:hypothetical protein